MPTLGRYEILEELGRGGMGVVYRAMDSMIGRVVAIKTIRLESSQESDTYRERLIREARTAGTLTHPNIVTIHDIGEQESVAFVVMELIEGQTLDSVAREGRSLDEFIRIITAAARALDYAHSKGVIHRDVKPANIMVQPDGVVKLLDFGIARPQTATAMTQAGMLVGTLEYMAPEQLKLQPYDGRSDQYALAATAYRVFTGRRPFEAEFPGIMTLIMNEPPDPPSAVVPALPLAIDAAILRALSKDPAKRFTNCVDFAAALTGRSSTYTTPQAAPVEEQGKVPKAPTPPPPQRKPVVLIGTAIVSLVALIGAIVWMRSRNAPLPATAPVPTITAVAPAPAAARDAAGLGAKPGETWTNPRDQQTYAWIPAGEFAMGCSESDSQCAPNEKPRHTVRLTKGFWLGQTEVTVAAFQRYAKVTARTFPAQASGSEQLPIVSVTWDEADGYCAFSGGRLPTEAEWEYAARAGDPSPRFDALDRVAWFQGNSDGAVHPPKQKQANAWGLFDMLGNAWEWTSDRYDGGGYSADPAIDPGGGPAGSIHVVRGGSFNTGPKVQRVSTRNGWESGFRRAVVGFRCAVQ